MRFLGELYPYQKEGVKFHLSGRFTINGFTMGLGKTPVALAMAAEALGSKGKGLVITPAFLRENWKREAKKFLSDPKRIEIVSYNQLSKIRNFPEFVVFDEAHYLKNIYAKRTTAAHLLAESSLPDYLLLLTGTPIKNRVPEFYSLLRLTWLGGGLPGFDEYAHSYHRFCKKFCHILVKRYPGMAPITSYEGLKNADELRALIKPVYLRRRAEQVLDLPAIVEKEIVVKDKAKVDASLEKAWKDYCDGGKKLSKAGATAKAVNALSKCDTTYELAEEILNQGQKLIVFSDHVEACHSLAKRFNCPAITGATPVGRRMGYVDAFEEEKLQVLCCTIGSMSVGLNLTSCHYMVFNDYPWVPADLEQAKKRIHRIGQKSTCFYYYILSSDLDRKILQTLKAKMRVMDEVLDA